jgi:hypothetical protein
MTAELVNPTSTATKPATTVDRDASLSHFFNMGFLTESLVTGTKIFCPRAPYRQAQRFAAKRA